MFDVRCSNVVDNIDAYLDCELDGDTSRYLADHLRECTVCADELSARTALKRRLKDAVDTDYAPLGLETRIRQTLNEGSRRPRPSYFARFALPVAAMFAIGIGLAITYQLGHLRLTVASQEAYIQSISARVPGLMRVGLGDHVHCTVFRKFPKNPPSVAEMAEKLGPDYKALLPAVSEHIGDDYRIVMGHRCSYHRRKFVHIAMTNGPHLLSLVIAKRGEGEAFQSSELPSMLADGIPTYRASVQRFSIAAFETHDHLVYVVSDLGQDENSRMLVALTRPIRSILVE